MNELADYLDDTRFDGVGNGKEKYSNVRVFQELHGFLRDLLTI